MKVLWSIDDANDMITQYKVCYKASENSLDIDCVLNETVNNVSRREVVLRGLNEATTYNVAVRAENGAGFGDFGPVVTNKTLEDSKRFHKLLPLK